MGYTRGERMAPVSTAARSSCGVGVAAAAAPASSQPRKARLRIKATIDVLRAGALMHYGQKTRWRVRARKTAEDDDGLRAAAALGDCARNVTTASDSACCQTDIFFYDTAGGIRLGILFRCKSPTMDSILPHRPCDPLAGRRVFAALVSANTPVPSQWRCLPCSQTGRRQFLDADHRVECHVPGTKDALKQKLG